MTCNVCGDALRCMSGVEWTSGVFEYLCFSCYLWSDEIIEEAHRRAASYIRLERDADRLP